MVFDVRGDMNRMINDMQRVRRDVIDTATVRTLNKVVDRVATAAAREMKSAGYNLKISDIKKGLTKQKATANNLTARVVASGKPIPLIRYSARQTNKGVTVNVLNGRKLIAHAFIATMPSGHTGVFIRQGTGRHKRVTKGSKTSWHALPIKELFGPGVPDGLANRSVQEALQRVVETSFADVFAQQVKYLSG